MAQAPNSRRSSEEEQIRIGWQMAGLGFEVASMVVGAAALGWLFDRWRGTAPNGVLYFSLVGIAVALFSLVKGTLKLNRRLDAIARRQRGATPPPSNPSIATKEPQDDEEDDWDRRWSNKWNDDDAESSR